MSTDGLEPLPEPAGVMVVGTQALRAFTADQMHAYAREHIAELEARLAERNEEAMHANRVTAQERDRADARIAALEAQVQKLKAEAYKAGVERDTMMKAFDEMTDERDAALRTIAALRNAGRPLANCAFNLSQQSGEVLSARVAETLRQARRAWDTAIQADHTEQRLAMVDSIQADKGAA